jgi:RNA-directed DNA polymerase
VDADLSKYFDSIPHDDLMETVRRRITDAHLLRLIVKWLKAPVEETDERGNKRLTGGKKNRHGTPQGGVISPLLANIYMNRYLKLWRRNARGETYEARIVNYADDFVILSRGHAEAALKWTRKVMAHLKLTLNEEKTRVVNARTGTFDFLGHTFGARMNKKWGKRYIMVCPSRKSVRRLKANVAEKLRPGNMEPWPEVAKSLNRTLDGWKNYFSHGDTYPAYREVNNYVCHKVRFFLNRRCKKNKLPLAGLWRTVFCELGVRSLLEKLRGVAPVKPCRETGRRAGCGKSARPVR